MFVILLLPRKMIQMKQQVVTIGYLFRNNTLSTQKMTQIAPNNQKGQEGQSAAPQIESRAIVDFLFALSGSPHSFLKRGHKNTWILVQICRMPHMIRTTLTASFSWLHPLQLHLTSTTNLLSQYGGRLLPLAARAGKQN
jgi:hypothetical protein